MESHDLAGITLKEIFEKILGEKNGREALLNIQQEYDKGMRGKELEKFAHDEIKKYDAILSVQIPIAFVNIR